MVTSPAPGSRRNRKRTWLLPYLSVQQEADSRVEAALRAAAKDVDDAITELAGKTKPGATVRSAQLVGSRGILTKIINDLYGKVQKITGEGQISATQAAREATNAWDRPILREMNLPEDFGLEQTSLRQVQSMITRVLNTERTLSENVWSAKALTNGQLNRLVNSSLAKGDGASDLAKRVRDFVRPNTPGGAAYAAKRLARTEINNAYHAQSIEANQNRPWVISMSWNLSGTHTPAPGDKCELYARIGSFAPDSVPAKPHPQCMCYVAPEVEDLEVTIARARRGEFDTWAMSRSE